MGRSQRTTTENHDDKKGLPLRWVVILSLGTGVGVIVGLFGGIIAGVPVGMAAVAGLHKIID